MGERRATRARLTGIAGLALFALPAAAAAQDVPPPPPGAGASEGVVTHVPGLVVLRVHLAPGDEIVAGTCGLDGASHRGDTTLTLRGPSGGQAAYNDDACGGLGSHLRHVATVAGEHTLHADCYGNRTSCGGVIAWKLGSAYGTARVMAAVALATPGDGAPAGPAVRSEREGSAPHVRDTPALRVHLERGERLVVGTCGLPGAQHVDDTTLRVLGPSGDTVAYNDDACSGLGSNIRHTARDAGVYTVVAGCYGDASCGGTIAYRVHDPLPPPPPFRIATVARGLLDVEGRGGALVADAVIEARWLEMFVLRLSGAPLGLGGGVDGGVATGTIHLSLLWDLEVVAIGLGGGVATLATRLRGLAQQEAGVLVAHARIGRLNMFHVEGQFSTAFFGDDAEVMSIALTARLPLPGVEIALRGAGGNDGTALGELALTFWLHSVRSVPVFGLSVHAGGSGVFYEPICRFGATCEPRWYTGPHLGLGMEWRP
ncbi:MAG: hypothetical protein KF729_17930 [Sandaracinaceae bacterium]|nr:hypothetical protein [Sandaracinaceae bacterium]